MGEDNNNQENKSMQRKCWQRLLVLLGGALVLLGPVVLWWSDENQAGWAVMIAGLIMMVISKFDDIEEIGLASFKAKMFERRVDEVEEAMRDIRRLAKQSTSVSLQAIQYLGRWGGMDRERKASILLENRRLLSDFGVSAHEIEEIEAPWHRAVEYDYAMSVLAKDSQIPRDLPKEYKSEWHSLRDRGIQRRPSPEELSHFLTKANMLTAERQDALDRYAHYVETREHPYQESE